jgi:hypothetical protein
VEHTASCPDVDPLLCATEDLPDHRHALRTDIIRLDLAAVVGLGGHWQARLRLPVELRQIAVDYTTMDGAAYDPPYQDIHHRNERLIGLADGELDASRFWRRDRWSVGGRAGLTLPLGSTEPNPYALGLLGETHQHHQLGAGMPLGVLGVSAVRSPAPWGAHANIGARLPIAENHYGYKAPLTVTSAAGGLRRLGTELLLMGGADVVVEGAEHWDGEPYQGRVAAQLDGGLEWSPKPRWAFSANARIPVWQVLVDHGHSDADGELQLAPSLSVGAAWTGPGAAAR